MIVLLQRVKKSSVNIEGKKIAAINEGLLIFVAFVENDTENQLIRMTERVLNYRIFSDHEGKMNKSVKDKNFDILVVPQFTLAANTDNGNRPSFSAAADPAKAQQLFLKFINCISDQHTNFQQGIFGADMQINLVNDGPVTFWLEVK
jgi:D-tyrosyl-tRNA(Tyr) deacylase